ncbi:MAG: DUF2147 domain-containing protein [Alphaproteobacteria bacterium]|nr:DUF2147 domain-containing protein [Alphaproteobacteria bacterium]MCL2758377.1 DUF2147 domain-containing protein [Alphaproteobacteria bacterium]
MKRIKLLAVYALCLVPYALRAEGAPLAGFYKTIDDATGAARSIIRLYECADSLCGRVVALYDRDSGEISETIAAPSRIAERVRTQPKMVGLDVIWDMRWNAASSEYTGGRIMDPQSGRAYTASIWQDRTDANILRVRGRIGPIGRTQNWHVMPDAGLPADLQSLDVSDWKPIIHR